MRLNDMPGTTLPEDDKIAVRASNTFWDGSVYSDEELKRFEEVYDPEGVKRKLDALEWARDFMNKYEKKHGKPRS